MSTGLSASVNSTRYDIAPVHSFEFNKITYVYELFEE